MLHIPVQVIGLDLLNIFVLSLHINLERKVATLYVSHLLASFVTLLLAHGPMCHIGYMYISQQL